MAEIEAKFLEGIVRPYKGNGRKLGYPTANIDVPTDLKDGVYFGLADLADYSHNPAVIFIGTPTTLGDSERRVEAYLFDVEDKDYYGEGLKIEINHFHRSNKTFDSVEELLKVMQDDETTARQWFAAKS